MGPQPPFQSPISDPSTSEPPIELRSLDEVQVCDTTYSNQHEIDDESNNRRLSDESKNDSRPTTTSNPDLTNKTSVKCQIVIAFLCILGLIPLFGIVIYLVGMFYGVPSTTSYTSIK